MAGCAIFSCRMRAGDPSTKTLKLFLHSFKCTTLHFTCHMFKMAEHFFQIGIFFFFFGPMWDKRQQVKIFQTIVYASRFTGAGFHLSGKKNLWYYQMTHLFPFPLGLRSFKSTKRNKEHCSFKPRYQTTYLSEVLFSKLRHTQGFYWISALQCGRF